MNIIYQSIFLNLKFVRDFFNRKFEFAQNIDLTLINISQDGALLWKTDQGNMGLSINDVINILYSLTLATLSVSCTFCQLQSSQNHLPHS